MDRVEGSMVASGSLNGSHTASVPRQQRSFTTSLSEGISTSTSPFSRLARTCAVPVNIQLSNNIRFVHQDSASRGSLSKNHDFRLPDATRLLRSCPAQPDDGGPG